MREGRTQTRTPTFSETRPEIDRNAGRLHFGMVAGFKSERWPAYVGIPGRNKSESAKHSINESEVRFDQGSGYGSQNTHIMAKSHEWRARSTPLERLHFL